MFRGIAIALSLSAGLLFSSTASAAMVFTTSSGSVSASASFEVYGSSLAILLQNTATADVLQPTDVLTGIFFNSKTSLTGLTAYSATLSSGSSVINWVGAQPTNVGGEWAWHAGFTSGAPAANGISATGLGLFSGTDLFPGSNLTGTDTVGGLDFGITSMGDNPSSGNGGISSNPLIKNGVIFVLSGLPVGFKLTDISNVSFQYGTALDEPRYASTPGVTVVPTPASLGGGLLLLGSLAFNRLRRRAA